ncbi:MAG: selenium-dependent molybdenum cofactor biosynthesis protein YqeB [Myxococcales bacterium]
MARRCFRPRSGAGRASRSSTEILLVRRREEPGEHSPKVRVIVNAGAGEGMGSSLRLAAQAIPEGTEAVVVGLADMPEVASTTISSLVAAWRPLGPRGIVAPTYQGRRGHPVVFGAEHLPALRSLTGDAGARAVLQERSSEAQARARRRPWRAAGPGRTLRPGGAAVRVLILGAGEHASSTAYRLFRAGFEVAMTEVPEPLAVRRSVSFCSAVWDGECTVEGVKGRLWKLGQALPSPLDHVAVLVDPEAAILSSWRPEVLVDARLLKRPGATSVSQAPLVISLGPGPVCGREAHVVIETNRGHDLGRVIEQGSAAPDTGVPGVIGGFAAERVLRAPVAGKVRGVRAIGDVVKAGDIVAYVGAELVHTTIAGVLRGILHDGVEATANVKLADVDPRAEVGACFTISDKSRTISGGVLEAILSRFHVAPK